MATWKLDKNHSELNFKVRHMMISNVKGRFADFDGSLTTEGEDFKNAKVEATVEVNSIDTNNKDRDAHLKSADFFNNAEHDKITFTSNGLDGDVTGELTMNGITKPVKLEVDFGGVNTDAFGNTKAGFSFEGKINRKDFEINWNAALEAGGVMVSDEVKISGDLQFLKPE